MHIHKRLSEDQYRAAMETPVEPHITPSVRGCQVAQGAAYFCDFVQKIILNDPTFGSDPDTRASNFNRGGYKIYTTLDVELQRTAEETIASYVPQTYDRANLGGALVGVQPDTGRVLYMAQNKQYSQDPDVLDSGAQYTSINYSTDQAYGGSGGFQVGSTYKVFTLADWLMKGHSLGETVNADIRTHQQSSFTDSCGGPWGGPWKPVNDSPGEEGTQSALNATAESINTAFVAMAKQLDLCDIRKRAEAFGVHPAAGGQLDTNPASVLGTNNVSPLTMATAFAGIANGGKSCTPIAIDTIVDATGKDLPAPTSECTQAVAPEIAASMAYALKRVTSYGTAAGMNRTGKDILAKTGTTDGNEQLWLVAASTKVAGAYWVGNIDGHADMRKIRPMHGTTPALARTAVMREMMGAAVAKYGGDDFPAPQTAHLRGSPVTIPDLTGQTIAHAQEALQAIGLNFEEGGVQQGDEPSGTVHATSPAAGSSAYRGDSVAVYTSAGPPVPKPAPAPINTGVPTPGK